MTNISKQIQSLPYTGVKRTISILILLFSFHLAFAQANGGSKIIGNYFTDHNRAKIAITQSGNKYVGTLLWTNIPNALDKNNPDKSQRQNKLEGRIILKDLVYDGEGEWKKGSIYDPESGKTYSCTLSFDKNGNLKVRGFVGVSLLGRTTIWTRTK